MKNKKPNKMSIDFDMKKDNEYQAEFTLGPNVTQYLEFKLDEAECGNLTYDEVENKAYDEAEKLWPVKSFPNLQLKQIKIYSSVEDDFCPVFSESMKSQILKCRKSDLCHRFLVLPDARYELTPEAKLWLAMKEQGLYNKYAPFDFNAMHELLQVAGKIK